MYGKSHWMNRNRQCGRQAGGRVLASPNCGARSARCATAHGALSPSNRPANRHGGGRSFPATMPAGLKARVSCRPLMEGRAHPLDRAVHYGAVVVDGPARFYARKRLALFPASLLRGSRIVAADGPRHSLARIRKNLTFPDKHARTPAILAIETYGTAASIGQL